MSRWGSDLLVRSLTSSCISSRKSWVKKLFHNWIFSYDSLWMFSSILNILFLKRSILFHNLVNPEYPKHLSFSFRILSIVSLFCWWLMSGIMPYIFFLGSSKWLINLPIVALALLFLSLLIIPTILNPACALIFFWLWVI